MEIDLIRRGIAGGVMRHLRPLGVLAVVLVMSVSVDADGVVQLDAEQGDTIGQSSFVK